MSRRNSSGFETIASLPWPVGVVLGIVAFVLVRYGIGWYLEASGNPMLAAVGRSTGEGFAILAWALLAICWLAAFVSHIKRARRKALLEAQTSLDTLRDMDWREFEMLVGEALRRKGYRVEETGLGGPDGGIDLRIHRDGKTTLVQCKQWRNRQVDVKVAREMYGLLAHHGADAVMIIAVGDFTPDARRFTEGKPIQLIHGPALLAMVRAVQTHPTSRSTGLRTTVPEQAKTPSCPNCGLVMVKRTNHRTHETFWGCIRYPACRGTRRT